VRNTSAEQGIRRPRLAHMGVEVAPDNAANCSISAIVTSRSIDCSVSPNSRSLNEFGMDVSRDRVAGCPHPATTGRGQGVGRTLHRGALHIVKDREYAISSPPPARPATMNQWGERRAMTRGSFGSPVHDQDAAVVRRKPRTIRPAREHRRRIRGRQTTLAAPGERDRASCRGTVPPRHGPKPRLCERRAPWADRGRAAGRPARTRRARGRTLPNCSKLPASGQPHHAVRRREPERRALFLTDHGTHAHAFQSRIGPRRFFEGPLAMPDHVAVTAAGTKPCGCGALLPALTVISERLFDVEIELRRARAASSEVCSSSTKSVPR